MYRASPPTPDPTLSRLSAKTNVGSLDSSKARLRTALSTFATIGVGAGIIMVLAIINGSPFIFYDSALYLGLGELLTAHDPSTAITTVLGTPGLSHAVVSKSQRAALLARAASHLGARSVVYSVYVATLSKYSMWIATAGQCLFVAACLWVTLRLIWSQALRRWNYLALVTALTVLTSLSIEAPILMPDAFTAPMILLIAALFSTREVNWGVQAGIAACVAVCVTVHLSHGPIAILAALVAAAILRLTVRGEQASGCKRNLAWIAGAVIAALSINAAVGCYADARIGWHLQKPPFLTGRVIDDGSGADYLIHDCHDSRYVVCRYANRILSNSGNNMMWSLQPQSGGVYLIEDPNVAAKMCQQNLAFVRDAITEYPLRQMLGSIRNVVRLMLSFNVDDVGSKMDFKFAYWQPISWGWIGTPILLSRLPNASSCSAHPNEICGRIPLAKLRILHYPVILFSVFVLLWRAWVFIACNGIDLKKLDRVETFALCVMGGILANDIVCGVLSGPYGRYQVRVVWLVPALALCMLIYSPEKLRLAGSKGHRKIA